MFTINTTIQDIDTKELLSFASVGLTDDKGKLLSINGNYITRKADIDGKLIIPVADEKAYITVSYVGYQSITHPADDYKNDIIYLKKKVASYGGKEIVVKAKKIKPKPVKPVPGSITEKIHKKKKKKSNNIAIIIGIVCATAVLGTALFFILKPKK